MKRVLVVETAVDHVVDFKEKQSLKLIQDFDEVHEARKWLREKAEPGTYTILTQIESDITVAVEQVRRSTVQDGHQFITRTTDKPEPSKPRSSRGAKEKSE